jgi:hypothetical protein
MNALASRLGRACVVIALLAPAISFAQRPVTSGSPLSSGLLMGRALHSHRVQLAGNSFSPVGVATVTCTTAPCVMADTRASNSGNQPVNSTAIAINPVNVLQIASAANDYNCPSLQDVFATGNTGSSFHKFCLGVANSTYVGAGDPVVAYDRNNNLFAGGIDCFMASCASTAIVLAKSTNNGLSFGTPIVAVNPLIAGGIADKPWLEIDTNSASPRVNTLYISTTQFDTSSNSTIAMSHSTDGGVTWSAPVALDSTQLFPNVDQFSDIAIGKDGTVYVTWMRCRSNGSGCGGTLASMMFAKSTDGGNTWTAPSQIAQVTLAPGTCGAFFGCLPNSFERVSNIPVIGVDTTTTTHTGYLYVAMYNYNTTTMLMRVQIVKSTNGGGTWSSPIGVTPSTATGDEFFPWLSVSSTGLVGVTWLDRRNDPANINYQAFVAYSAPGGTGFSTTNTLMSSAASNPMNDGFGGNFMGDYTGNMWNSGGLKLFAAWPDTRSGIASADYIGGYYK